MSTEIDLSPWENKDPLTLEEAAYLWAGVPPTLWKRNTLYPERCAAAAERAKQIRQAAEDGKIEYRRPITTVTEYKTVPGGGVLSGPRFSGWSDEFSPPRRIKQAKEGPVSWSKALFTRAALKAYADSIGQRPGFLFPEAARVDAMRCLDRTGSHFSAELEAAILAWQYASEMADSPKKKPRQLIEEWLRKERPSIAEGSKAFERIATLANWEKTPGTKPLKQ